MPNQLVKNWFGNRFSDLHPLLQQLHLEGGALKGKVNISYGNGIAGILGQRLARKMTLPNAGEHELLVQISHDDEYLHWSRSFGNSNVVHSLFKPVGSVERGYWLETTGPVAMRLTVDVRNGGWYWRCLKVCLFGIPIPVWLVPESNAYKVIVNGRYKFHVSFSFPFFGELVRYEGMLDALGDGDS